MSITSKTNRKNLSSEPRSALNTVIRRSTVKQDTPFITEDRVPAGTYHSKVVGVYDAINSKGKPALDIVYSLADSSGAMRHAKERLNLEGYMLEMLIEHWIDAGQLDESATYASIQGIEETVTVAYNRPGGFGTLQDRKPRKSIVQSVAATKSVPSKAKDSIVDDDDDILLLDEEDDYLDLEKDDE